FVAVVVLLTALIAPIAKPAKRRLGKGLVRPASKIFLPPVLGFFLLITNSTVVLFVGTNRTPPAFFLILPALFGFAAFAIVGLQNVTTSDEFQALALLSSLGARNVTTDQRMADVGRMWFGYVANPDLPQKLRDHASLEGADYALVLERWTTIGAQIHPAPNIVLAPETLAAFLATNRVVYETGLPGDRILVVQILP